MAIASYSTYATRCKQPSQLIQLSKVSTSCAGFDGRFNSYWSAAPNAGSTPSTAEVPTRTVAGAIGQANPSGTLRILRGELTTDRYLFGLIIADRLSHQGGLSGTATGAQTTNLPTAALTRYTDGVGVMAMLEIYTAIGTSGATVTASYTNQAGSSGQTTIATPFGVTNYSAVRRAVILPLASGDSGVRAVASVTLSGSTGTAGNFGVTLFRPLVMFPTWWESEQADADGLLSLGGLLPQVLSDACLMVLAVGRSDGSGGSASAFCANLFLNED